jgi:WD40 repeat protein
MPILLAFLPDGKSLLQVGRRSGKSAHVWDLATGKVLRTVGDHQEDIRTAALAPDGRRLVTAGYDRDNKHTISLWEMATGKELRRWQARGEAVAFSPNGKTLATSDQHSIRLHELDMDKVVPLPGASDDCCLAFAPDSNTLASGSWEGTVAIWDVATRKLLRKINAQFNAYGAVTRQALAFSTDGAVLATINHTQDAVRLWDPATGKLIRQFERTKPVGVVFSPDGKLLATLGGTAAKGTLNDSIPIWEWDTGKLVREFRGKHSSLNSLFFTFAFSPDGTKLAGGGINKLYLWDLATGNDLLASSSAPLGRVSALAYSPDGQLVATGGIEDGVIRLWEPGTGRPVGQLGEDRHTQGVSRFAFSPRRDTLASVGLDNTLLLWDLATGRMLRQFQGDFQAVLYATFSPDGKTLVSCGRDPQLRLWEAATGKELRRIAGPHDYLLGATFSPDGKLLAGLSANFRKERPVRQDGAVVVWDAATGKEKRRWSLAVRPLVEFAPDSRLLVGAESDGRPEVTVHLWDITTGRERHFPVARRGHLGAQALSPDGKTVALGYSDGTVVLCELLSGQVRRRWEGHRAGVGALAFSPDGRTLTSGSDDATALIWDVTGLEEGRRRLAAFSAQQLDALWSALGDTDAARAYQALWTLTTVPEQTAPFIRQRLQPAALEDQTKIQRLLADLQSDRFMVRQRAMQKLDQLGGKAEPALLHALANAPPLELRRRLEQLLDKLQTVFETDPASLRALRAVEVLEHLGTPAAGTVLQALAQGAPEARLTHEAKSSLDRLIKRPVTKP